MGMCWRVSGTLRIISSCVFFLKKGLGCISCIEGRTCFCMCKLLSRAGHVFACVSAFQRLCVYLHVSACSVYLRSSCIKDRTCFYMCNNLRVSFRCLFNAHKQVTFLVQGFFFLHMRLQVCFSIKTRTTKLRHF